MLLVLVKQNTVQVGCDALATMPTHLRQGRVAAAQRRGLPCFPSLPSLTIRHVDDVLGTRADLTMKIERPT